METRSPAPQHRGHPLPLISPGWRNAGREFLVIVTGVLVALAGQAWWQHRQDRSYEQEYLAQLLADTRENERRLEEAIADASAANQAIARVMRTMLTPGPLPPADSLMEWIGRSGRSSDVKPLTGTYGALLATGDLRLLRNDSLRALVVSYAASLDGEIQRLRQMRGTTLDLVEPMARTLPFLRGAFVRGVSPVETDFERMRRDSEAVAVLFTIQALHENRLSGLQRALDETRRLRLALEAEPGLESHGDGHPAPAALSHQR